MVKKQYKKQPELPFGGEKVWSNPVLRAKLEEYGVLYKDDQEAFADTIRPIYDSFVQELSPRERAVIATFGRAYGTDLTIEEIATDTKMEAKTVHTLLSRLTAANILERISRGRYHLTDDRFFLYFAFHCDTEYINWARSKKLHGQANLGTIIDDYIAEMKEQGLKHQSSELVNV